MKKKIEEFFQELKEIDIRNVQIPEHKIPGWPGELNIGINLTPRLNFLWLGKKKVNFIVNSRSGQYTFKDKLVRVVFFIKNSGSYGVEFWEVGDDNSSHYKSDDYNLDSRINALYIFQKYFDIIHEKVMTYIKEDIESNDEVIDTVEKAFEPFIPYYTANILSK